VLRPGGRLGLCNWTPEGSHGHFFWALGAYLPPPPQPPLLWGTEDHVRELFAGSGVQLEFERDTVIETESFETGRKAVDFVASNFGPLMMLRGASRHGASGVRFRKKRKSSTTVRTRLNTWSCWDGKDEDK
jgi:hypothetical protein